VPGLDTCAERRGAAVRQQLAASSLTAVSTLFRTLCGASALLHGDSESRRRSWELRDSTGFAGTADPSLLRPTEPPDPPPSLAARPPDAVPACVNAEPLPPELRLDLGCGAAAPAETGMGHQDTDLYAKPCKRGSRCHGIEN